MNNTSHSPEIRHEGMLTLARRREAVYNSRYHFGLRLYPFISAAEAPTASEAVTVAQAQTAPLEADSHEFALAPDDNSRAIPATETALSSISQTEQISQTTTDPNTAAQALHEAQARNSVSQALGEQSA